MRPPLARQLQAGFTLLEVLISISLFALVVSSVYGAYRATFQTVHATENQVTLAVAARVILERFSEDLESLAIDKDSYLRGTRGDVSGARADSLSCISSAHLLFNRTERPAGRTALSYSIVETDLGLFDVYRSDIPVVPGGKDREDQEDGVLLGRGLQEFRITYVDGDGSEYEDWSSGEDVDEAEESEEDTQIRLPVMVRLEIRLAGAHENGKSTLFRTAVALPALPAADDSGG